MTATCDATRSQDLDRHVAETFRHLSGPVLGYAAGMVGDADGAQDVAQEVFFRYFCELREGREIREPRAWAFRVAYRLALNQRRASRRFVHIGDAGWSDRFISEPCVLQRLEEQERRERVHEALAGLSSRERLCLEMRSEGLRYREIADRLQIRISSVSNYMDRAIQKIAGDLEGA